MINTMKHETVNHANDGMEEFKKIIEKQTAEVMVDQITVVMHAVRVGNEKMDVATIKYKANPDKRITGVKDLTFISIAGHITPVHGNTFQVPRLYSKGSIGRPMESKKFIETVNGESYAILELWDKEAYSNRQAFRITPTGLMEDRNFRTK